jgi:hypothetical protein
MLEMWARDPKPDRPERFKKEKGQEQENEAGSRG